MNFFYFYKVEFMNAKIQIDFIYILTMKELPNKKIILCFYNEV